MGKPTEEYTQDWEDTVGYLFHCIFVRDSSHSRNTSPPELRCVAPTQTKLVFVKEVERLLKQSVSDPEG